MTTTNYQKEIKSGQRFAFGKNWKRFLSVLDDERIAEAEKSLKIMLNTENLSNKSFLDVGSGSGLFSLAARRLGAKVYSFDYDPDSVACSQYLKSLYYPNDRNWKISQGSILDNQYIELLGQFDIVYSWGVLHHTGHLWQALEQIKIAVARDGILYIAIYNDQGFYSKIWLKIKEVYCSGAIGRFFVSAFMIPFYFILGAFVVDIVHLKNPIGRYREYKKRRGMSLFYDWFDWLGGLPFEVAHPESIINFFKKSNFDLKKIQFVGKKLGCNEYIFIKKS
ncbi:MAG: class I SAM-dependent methyltransferase [Jaaginema sp. PMC 1080.18]|nr:class I SAM-dependent methyltransferase [Jaaginema sp. PMC 1080.18]